jgi:hypothetical protein
MLIPFNFEFSAQIKCAPIFKLSEVYKLHPIRRTGPFREFDRTGSGGTSAATVLRELLHAELPTSFADCSYSATATMLKWVVQKPYL